MAIFDGVYQGRDEAVDSIFEEEADNTNWATDSGHLQDVFVSSKLISGKLLALTCNPLSSSARTMFSWL